jgi:hypothetical protein
MAASFESVRSKAIPRSVLLRVATGRAVDALVVFEINRQLSESAVHSLRKAAALLRPTSVEQPLKAGRSLADYKHDIGLIRAARNVWKGSKEASGLATELNSAANKLERVADGHEVSNQEIEQLKETLRALRDAVAASYPSVSERVVRPR